MNDACPVCREFECIQEYSSFFSLTQYFYCYKFEMRASLFFSNEFLFMTKIVLEEGESIFTITLDWIDLSTEIFKDSSLSADHIKFSMIIDEFALITNRAACVKKIKVLFLLK